MRRIVRLGVAWAVLACAPKDQDAIRPEHLRDAYCVGVLEAQKKFREQYAAARATFQTAAAATGEPQAAGCAAVAGQVQGVARYLDGFHDAGYALATASRVKPETLRLRRQVANVEKRCRDADMTVIDELTAAEQELDQAVGKQLEFCTGAGFEH